MTQPRRFTYEEWEALSDMQRRLLGFNRKRLVEALAKEHYRRYGRPTNANVIALQQPTPGWRTR